ncbi:MAG: endolytic transglycosylase MltG [Patescibacteria group bacterium]|nr:endolytic transglycosylase MltG [Patescibacteria group bacterium]
MFKTKFIILFFLFLFLTTIFSVVIFSIVISTPYDKLSGFETFKIESGQSVNEISRNLKKQGIIHSSFVFEIYLWLLKSEGKIKAGNYNLDCPINIKDLSEILIQGQKIGLERKIKIIEGWNIKDIAKYLADENITAQNDFLDFVKNYKIDNTKFSFLTDTKNKYDLEGFLFPDTYKIYKDAQNSDIVNKMLNNFNQKITKKIRSDIQFQNKTLFEIIIIASIIEKEVRNENDMKIVSGIFWDRIKNGQPLESCATIGYILGENKRQYSYEDTRIDSPYNTYLRQGLPSGPICNPGLKAIKAAVYPEFTEYNYFLSKKNGETVFSKTFKEHSLNTRKYLK